jgi:glutathione synthase
MNIAFLADPISTFKIIKDSTFAMMREAAGRGYAIHVFEQRDMVLEEGVVSAEVTRIHLTGEADAWYRAEAPEIVQLSVFDAVIERKDPPFDMEYVYGTYLLELAERQGARVFNRPGAIRDHNEKLTIAQFSQYTSPTLVSSNPARLRAFHEKHGDVIFKPLDGMGGAGIFRIKDDGMNLGSVIESLTDNGRHTIMAQKFIPAIKQGDKRVLVIGGKPVPFALARIRRPGPGPADHRARARNCRGDRSGTGGARLIAGRIGCDRRLPDRSKRHQPDLLPGDRRPDRIRRGRDVHRRGRTAADREYPRETLTW